LKKNKGKKYTSREIQKEVNIGFGSLSQNLLRLKKAKIIKVIKRQRDCLYYVE